MKKELFPIDWKRADVLIQLALEEDLADRGDKLHYDTPSQHIFGERCFEAYCSFKKAR